MSSVRDFFKIVKMDAKTLIWWKSRRKLIDMSPSYQRKGRRWSVGDKQYLIDSILNGFDIPKFYLVDFTWGSSPLNENSLDYAVVDGKQRLEAIFDFFDDEFSLSKDFSLLVDPGLRLGGMKYSVLKKEYPHIAEIFDNFNLDVVTVVANKKDYIEELFLRLNRSKPLSGAEVRNAISGEASGLVRQIQHHEFFTSNIKFNTGKGQDLNCAAKILMFEVNGGPAQETKKASLDRFAKTNAVLPGASDTLVRVIGVLDMMSETFKYKDPILQSEGPIPVYYWLFRESSPQDVFYIRDFLEDFVLGVSGDSAYAQAFKNIEEYRAASRSINDKSSHLVRYEILRTNFLSWRMCN